MPDDQAGQCVSASIKPATSGTIAGQNTLLSILSAADRALLEPSLEHGPFTLGEKLEEHDREITHVYFPHSGVLTVTAAAADARIEIGMIGYEGMTGTGVVLGSRRTPYAIQAHMDGNATRITADALCSAMSASASLRAVLLRYSYFFLIQVAQTALANGHAKLEARTARWLLMVHDRVGRDPMLVTHEFIARALAVRRPGITDVLHLLEERGLVRAKRGAIAILDREGLRRLAGPTYGSAEAEYRRLVLGQSHEKQLSLAP